MLIHQYGPHIFHTNSQQIVDYLSQFTEWRPYEHRVLAQVDGKLRADPDQPRHGQQALRAEPHLRRARGLVRRARRAGRRDPDLRGRRRLARSGRELYEKFFRGYTRKQWGLDPSELDKSVTARVPTRTNRDDRYFTDNFQAMPQHGYTRMFERMLDHPNINVMAADRLRATCSDVVPHRRRHLHRADRRIFRLPLRQAALPLAALPAT